MKNQLIPPPELAPPSIGHLATADKVRLWAQLVDDGDELLMAGFRMREGADADVKAAYRDWSDRRNQEHDKKIARMITELRRRERNGAK